MMNHLFTRVVSVLAFMGMASVAMAHGVYFADRLDQKRLVLGEGPLDNAYQPSMLKKLSGVDVRGHGTLIKQLPAQHYVAVEPSDDLGISLAVFDYGYFTRDQAGKMHAFKQFHEVPHAKNTIHAMKYNVHYWHIDAKPQKLNAYIEIVPSVNPLGLHKGDRYEIQVFKDGQPFANAPIIPDVINDLTHEIKADSQGRATLTVNANGLNVVGVEVALPNKDKRIKDKYFSSLSFTIYPD